MNSVPPFQNHVFISYSHLDNLPAIKGQTGWIDEFDRVLKIRLQEFLGEESKVWRDKKLHGNDILSNYHQPVSRDRRSCFDPLTSVSEVRMVLKGTESIHQSR